MALVRAVVLQAYSKSKAVVTLLEMANRTYWRFGFLEGLSSYDFKIGLD